MRTKHQKEIIKAAQEKGFCYEQEHAASMDQNLQDLRQEFNDLLASYEDSLDKMAWLQDCAACWCDQLKGHQCGTCDAHDLLVKVEAEREKNHPSPAPGNESRRECARKVMTGYGGRGNELHESITDFLTDLQHLADHEGLDLIQCERSAEKHYNAELHTQ